MRDRLFFLFHGCNFGDISRGHLPSHVKVQLGILCMYIPCLRIRSEFRQSKYGSLWAKAAPLLSQHNETISRGQFRRWTKPDTRDHEQRPTASKHDRYRATTLLSLFLTLFLSFFFSFLDTPSSTTISLYILFNRHCKLLCSLLLEQHFEITDMLGFASTRAQRTRDTEPLLIYCIHHSRRGYFFFYYYYYYFRREFSPKEKLHICAHCTFAFIFLSFCTVTVLRGQSQTDQYSRYFYLFFLAYIYIFSFFHIPLTYIYIYVFFLNLLSPRLH